MTSLEIFFLLQLGVQIAHSLEESVTEFHKDNFFVHMSLRTFLLFELVFTAAWIVIFLSHMVWRDVLLALFMLLMFANGIWHLVWARIEKRYVPGLYTAPLHVAVFVWFYFSVVG